MRSQRLSARAGLLVMLVACGGDDGNTVVGQPGPPPPPPAANAANQLQAKLRIEDRASDAERGTIRHQFHDRDFLDSNRDPFATPLLQGAGGQGSGGPVVAKAIDCHSRIIAPNYSYADLRLVGIVHQGIQNRVLMMDPGNVGRIIATGECVGKEKAVIKEITQNHVTFLVQPEVGPGQGLRPAEEYSVKLHEHDLDATASTDLSAPNPEPEAAPVLPSNSRTPAGTPVVPATAPAHP